VLIYVASETKRLLADVLSVLAMTIDGEDSLAFKLAGAPQDVTAWGHEYLVCHMCSTYMCVFIKYIIMIY
jgi:hypothetical protein